MITWLLRFKFFRKFVNMGIEPYGLRVREPGEGIYDGMTDDELEAFRAQRRERAAGSIYDGISAKEMARIQEKAGSPKTWDDAKKVEE